MRNKHWSLIAALGLLCSLVFASSVYGDESKGQSGYDEDEPRVTAELLVDAMSVSAGSQVRVGVRLQMHPGWHVYWKNSGDAGFPTEIEWQSADMAMGSLTYPAPSVYLESQGLAKTFGYSDEVLIFATADVSTEATEAVDIDATVRFLVCKVLCIPGEIQLRKSVPVVSTAQTTQSPARAIFDRFSKQLPMPALAHDVSTRHEVKKSEVDGQKFELKISVLPCASKSPDCGDRVAFLPSPGEFAPEFAPSLELDVVGAQAHPDNPDGVSLLVNGRVLKGQVAPDELKGVLRLRVNDQPVFVAVNLPLLQGAGVSKSVDSGSEDLSAKSPKLSTSAVPVSISIALLLAIVGGAILNFMPCVLPVLALKVFRIVESHHASRNELRLQAIAYSFGVLVSMAILAIAVIALKAAGQAVGWGFQFQQPLFLAFMGTLLIVFSLNLFGVFSISVPTSGLANVGQSGSALRRSFFDGVLVVLLATPCSAPFLGTATGFALVNGPIIIIAVFIFIGVGLALPYLLLSLVPGLASTLPKPGPWMLNLQVLLGFALLATALWLLWIAGLTIGANGVISLLALFLAVAFLMWVFGRVQRRSNSVVAAYLVFVVVIISAILSVILPLEQTQKSMATRSEFTARIWDPATVEQLVLTGNPVFVDFTADWCVTCKFNERLIFKTQRVREEMKRHGLTWFQADWTVPNDAIRDELARHHRAAVPLYLLYRPNDITHPMILPEILTSDSFIAYLDKLYGSGE